MDYFDNNFKNNNDNGNYSQYGGGNQGGGLPPYWYGAPNTKGEAVTEKELQKFKKKAIMIVVVAIAVMTVAVIIFMALYPTVLSNKIKEEAVEMTVADLSQQVIEQYKRQYNLPDDYWGIGVAVASKCINSVVVINCQTTKSNRTTASGIIVSANGYVLTNAHVVTYEDNDREFQHASVKAVFNNQSYTLNVIDYDSANDLALCKFVTVPTGIVPVVFEDSDYLNMGEEAAILGNANGMGISITTGVISQTPRDYNFTSLKAEVLQTSAAVNPGNSGGPIFNIYGECIGVVTAKIAETSVELIGFAISSNNAMDYMKSLRLSDLTFNVVDHSSSQAA